MQKALLFSLIDKDSQSRLEKQTNMQTKKNLGRFIRDVPKTKWKPKFRNKGYREAFGQNGRVGKGCAGFLSQPYKNYN